MDNSWPYYILCVTFSFNHMSFVLPSASSHETKQLWLSYTQSRGSVLKVPWICVGTEWLFHSFLLVLWDIRYGTSTSTIWCAVDSFKSYTRKLFHNNAKNWWDWGLKSASGLLNGLLQANTCRVPNSLFFLEHIFILKAPHHYQAWSGLNICPCFV